MSSTLVAYVDSADEQLAFLVSRLGPQETWSVTEQRMGTDAAGNAMERARVSTSHGDFDVEFRDAHPQIDITAGDNENNRTGILDAVMRRASTFAAENPPHHPGSLPRFPVPVEYYDQAVGVPLPILAVDDRGRKGLYSPPRMAVVSWTTQEPIGVRELEGFDPGRWPPPRLGDWPAPSVTRLTTDELDACIQRYGACWSRVIDVWLGRDAGDALPDSLSSDIRDAFRLREMLDLPAMEAVYRSMNLRFAAWLDEKL